MRLLLSSVLLLALVSYAIAASAEHPHNHHQQHVDSVAKDLAAEFNKRMEELKGTSSDSHRAQVTELANKIQAEMDGHTAATSKALDGVDGVTSTRLQAMNAELDQTKNKIAETEKAMRARESDSLAKERAHYKTMDDLESARVARDLQSIKDRSLSASSQLASQVSKGLDADSEYFSKQLSQLGRVEMGLSDSIGGSPTISPLAAASAHRFSTVVNPIQSIAATGSINSTTTASSSPSSSSLEVRISQIDRDAQAEIDKATREADSEIALVNAKRIRSAARLAQVRAIIEAKIERLKTIATARGTRIRALYQKKLDALNRKAARQQTLFQRKADHDRMKNEEHRLDQKRALAKRKFRAMKMKYHFLHEIETDRADVEASQQNNELLAEHNDDIHHLKMVYERQLARQKQKFTNSALELHLGAHKDLIKHFSLERKLQAVRDQHSREVLDEFNRRKLARWQMKRAMRQRQKALNKNWQQHLARLKRAHLKYMRKFRQTRQRRLAYLKRLRRYHRLHLRRMAKQLQLIKTARQRKITQIKVTARKQKVSELKKRQRARITRARRARIQQNQQQVKLARASVVQSIKNQKADLQMQEMQHRQFLAQVRREKREARRSARRVKKSLSRAAQLQQKIATRAHRRYLHSLNRRRSRAEQRHQRLLQLQARRTQELNLRSWKKVRSAEDKHLDSIHRIVHKSQDQINRAHMKQLNWKARVRRQLLKRNSKLQARHRAYIQELRRKNEYLQAQYRSKIRTLQRALEHKENLSQEERRSLRSNLRSFRRLARTQQRRFLARLHRDHRNAVRQHHRTVSALHRSHRRAVARLRKLRAQARQKTSAYMAALRRKKSRAGRFNKFMLLRLRERRTRAVHRLRTFRAYLKKQTWFREVRRRLWTRLHKQRQIAQSHYFAENSQKYNRALRSLIRRGRRLEINNNRKMQEMFQETQHEAGVSQIRQQVKMANLKRANARQVQAHIRAVRRDMRDMRKRFQARVRQTNRTLAQMKHNFHMVYTAQVDSFRRRMATLSDGKRAQVKLALRHLREQQQDFQRRAKIRAQFRRRLYQQRQASYRRVLSTLQRMHNRKVRILQRMDRARTESLRHQDQEKEDWAEREENLWTSQVNRLRNWFQRVYRTRFQAYQRKMVNLQKWSELHYHQYVVRKQQLQRAQHQQQSRLRRTQRARIRNLMLKERERFDENQKHMQDLTRHFTQRYWQAHRDARSRLAFAFLVHQRLYQAWQDKISAVHQRILELKNTQAEWSRDQQTHYNKLRAYETRAHRAAMKNLRRMIRLRAHAHWEALSHIRQERLQLEKHHMRQLSSDSKDARRRYLFEFNRIRQKRADMEQRYARQYFTWVMRTRAMVSHKKQQLLRTLHDSRMSMARLRDEHSMRAERQRRVYARRIRAIIHRMNEMNSRFQVRLTARRARYLQELRHVDQQSRLVWLRHRHQLSAEAEQRHEEYAHHRRVASSRLYRLNRRQNRKRIQYAHRQRVRFARMRQAQGRFYGRKLRRVTRTLQDRLNFSNRRLRFRIRNFNRRITNLRKFFARRVALRQRIYNRKLADLRKRERIVLQGARRQFRVQYRRLTAAQRRQFLSRIRFLENRTRLMVARKSKQYQRLMSAYRVKLAQQKRAYMSRLLKWRMFYLKRLHMVQQRQAARVQTAKNTHSHRLDKLRNTHLRRVSRLKNLHADAVNRLKSEHQDWLQGHTERMMNFHRRAHARIAGHQQETQNHEEFHARRMDSLEKIRQAYIESHRRWVANHYRRWRDANRPKPGTRPAGPGANWVRRPQWNLQVVNQRQLVPVHRNVYRNYQTRVPYQQGHWVRQRVFGPVWKKKLVCKTLSGSTPSCKNVKVRRVCSLRRSTRVCKKRKWKRVCNNNNNAAAAAAGDDVEGRNCRWESCQQCHLVKSCPSENSDNDSDLAGACTWKRMCTLNHKCRYTCDGSGNNPFSGGNGKQCQWKYRNHCTWTHARKCRWIKKRQCSKQARRSCHWKRVQTQGYYWKKVYVTRPAVRTEWQHGKVPVIQYRYRNHPTQQWVQKDTWHYEPKMTTTA